jgi:antitoxin MazE
MEMIPIKNLMEFLELKTDDRVSIKSEDINGKRRLIIEPAISKEEITIEELFKDYTEGKVNIKIQDLGSPVGRELW